MSIYSELAYDRVVSTVRGIQFCVLSEQEIRRRSVCEVVEGKTFEGNEPVPGGLFDTRMGVVDGSRTCATCQQRNTFCPGHFGHIMLARPVFYIQFFDIVRKVMKCVCFRCSRLLVDLDGPEAKALLGRKISRQKRWEAMSKLCQKVKRCGQDTLDGCGAKVPDKVIKTEEMRMTLVWRDASSSAAAAAAAANGSSSVREVTFNAEDVMRVLRGISDAHCEALGFSAEHARPEWMICTALPVPPPAVRPSVRHDTGQRQEDDLTHKLCDIVKWNNTVRDRIARGSTLDAIEAVVPLVQYHVATLIDNSMPSMYPSKDRAGRTFRSLTERLRHKEGRIRGNLMGKRVDFSARTVITPDPNLSIDELGVPMKIAMNLTFPEVVGPLTRAELQRLVLNGPDVYPGAKQVRKTADANRTIRLKGHPDPASIVLDDGDVVERHLRNGDYVLFNRQPSLHKMSMMAHRVRVMPYHTFRLNVCVCASYNADFDGDEMNMHVPQSLQSLYEIKELAAVPLHVLSPRYSMPIITIVQDVALGVFRITQPNVRVTQRQLFNLACGNELMGSYATSAEAGAEVVGQALMGVAPGEKRVDASTSSADVWSDGRGGATDLANGAWTGRQVLSTVLPPTASVIMRNNLVDSTEFVPDIHEVVIDGGVIRSGVLSEKVFSQASRGLVHSTYNTLGAAAVTAMLNSTQKLVCDWLVLSGFSVGVSDLVVPAHNVERKIEALDAAKANVREAMRGVHAGTFENNSTKSNSDYLEEQIMAKLLKGSESAGKICREGFGIDNNRMLNMILSGSKGKTVNFMQMTACLGQQSIEQKRVPDGFDGRTLPHFTKFDDGPQARGFVEHSFIEGLTPHEFFFHAMAGRIGLIDTAVRSVTWDTAVLIVDAGVPRRVRIGAWIDGLLELSCIDGLFEGKKDNVQHFPEDRNLELLELSNLPGREVYIPTADSAGRTSWGLLTAVTRHDPGERLYRVKTAGGREATVAESNSLLVWKTDTETFEPTHSAEVRVGDCLPVMARTPATPDPLVKTFVYAEELSGTGEVHGGARLELDERSGRCVGIFLAGGGRGKGGGTNGAVWDASGCAWVFADGDTDRGFRDAFLGDGGGVPALAHVAPLAFVRGLLSGYFAGEGTSIDARRGIISVAGATPLMAEGVAAMCARLGAFATLTENGLEVAPMWAGGLAAQLEIEDPVKNAALKDIATSEIEAERQRNDVVLDPIVTIDVLGTEAFPKLYDVTVPSTLNYALANGLVSRDTSETGYLQRRLVKAMEDCKIHHDLTVRNANNFIVQFLYGEDGMDAIKLEFHELPTLEREPAELRDDYLLVNADAELRGLLDDATMRGVLDRERSAPGAWAAKCAEHFKALVDDRRDVIQGLHGGLKVHNQPIVYPVNVRRIVDIAAALQARATPGALSDLDPVWVLDRVERLAAELRVGGENRTSAKRSAGVRWMPVLLRCFLSPKPLIRKFRMTRETFERVVSDVRRDFYSAVANPGEMTGIVAAQSIGEISTQLTLNTFHGAGVSSFTKVTSGVPRLKELMSMSKNIKTPGMAVKLKREWATSQERAQEVMSSIQTTHFRDLVLRSSVHFDPSDAETTVGDDAALMAFYVKFGALERSTAGCDARASPWLLRFEFDRIKMLSRKVTMLDLEATLVDHNESTVSCVLSDDNAERLICRLRIAALPADSDDLLTEIKALEISIMDRLVVKGLARIHKAVLGPPVKSLDRFDAVIDAFVGSDEWSIETAGSNLMDVLGHPCVDFSRTTTNDVHEVYTVLGIEAARMMLIKELRAVLGNDTPLDHRHLALLADTMSNRGFFMSIDRHGINNRGELGPLAKCSFEQTIDMLIKAGVFAERDRINGVSANIMLGQVAPCGTGDCRVLIDGERLSALATPVEIDPSRREQRQAAAATAGPRAEAAAAQQQEFDVPAAAFDTPTEQVAARKRRTAVVEII